MTRAILAATCILALASVAVWVSARPAATRAAMPILATPRPQPTSAVAATPAGPQFVVPPGRPQIAVPILEYHYIRVNPNPADRLGYNLSVTPDNFKAQMDWLDKNGYHPVTLDEVRAYFQQNQPLPAKPVVLSFDDGYLDFYTVAFPILQAHHFKAVAYIVPGFLNRKVYMKPDEIVAIDRSGLVEIGSHTMTHANVARENATQLAYQLGQSKAELENLLGHPVLDFCYPSGAFSDTAIAALVSYGYQSATTELPGTEHAWFDRMTWTRERVWGGERLSQFIAYLGTPDPTVLAPTPSPSPVGQASQ